MVAAFCNGVSAAASIVVAAFFLRFWRETEDRLFGYLALGFALLAVNWATLSLLIVPAETRHFVYLVRLGAFVVLLGGLVDKYLSESADQRW
jgi:hypothetical protein